MTWALIAWLYLFGLIAFGALLYASGIRKPRKWRIALALALWPLSLPALVVASVASVW